MTGKQLICYILENNLEDKSVSTIFSGLTVQDILLNNCIAIEKYAARCNVGVETVKVWIKRGWICGILIKDTIYILGVEE